MIFVITTGDTDGRAETRMAEMRVPHSLTVTVREARRNIKLDFTLLWFSKVAVMASDTLLLSCDQRDQAE